MSDEAIVNFEGEIKGLTRKQFDAVMEVVNAMTVAINPKASINWTFWTPAKETDEEDAHVEAHAR